MKHYWFGSSLGIKKHKIAGSSSPPEINRQTITGHNIVALVQP